MSFDRYEHCALGDDHVALAQWHIARQKEIISQLRQWNQPTALAEDLLKTFEGTLREHIRVRDLRTHLNTNFPDAH